MTTTMDNVRLNKIADKIQKLLALAGNNPSEQEAKEALLKAQELMAQYNVDMENLPNGKAIRYELITTKVKAHKWNNTLGSILGDAFACKVIISMGKISFFGRSDNAQAVASAMEFAYKVMVKGGNRATRNAGLEPGHTGAAHYYNAYVLGFLHGLKQAMDAQTVALAVVVPKDVEDAFHHKYPDIRYTRKSHTKAAYGEEAYAAGMQDGSSVMDKRSITT